MPRAGFKQLMAVFLLFSVAAIGLLHACTPDHLVFYHDSYRRLSYFPIVIGAILYGVKGGLGFAAVSCLAFVPHLYMFWARGPEAYYSELSEIVFYLAAGLVIGLISSRESRLQEKYKTLSEKLAASYQRLHHQASLLLAAEKQLEKRRKLSLLGQVSATLAHEIKNPLASIKGAAEILADEIPQGHSKYEFIEIMRSEILRLNHSVDDVLSYCRGQEQPSREKKAFLETVVSRVIKLLDSRITEKKIRVAVHIHADVSRFEVDEAGMIQVLMNLLINAVEAVGFNGHIRVDATLLESMCCIRISDDGPGIDSDRVEAVFQPFETFKDGGTGLGLSISKRIIESLGGTIAIEASSLGGAGFLIQLPTEPFEEHH